MWKFRSMRVTDGVAAYKQATRGDPRITPVGKFIRQYSIDELPQLINVLDGSMSVVGPRPHPVRMNEDKRGLINRYMQRHMVKPGITGLAQVNGYRGETDTPEKLEKRIQFDLAYIESWSPFLDIRILVRTAAIVLSDPNAY